jgi:hypothetical protein
MSQNSGGWYLNLTSSQNTSRAVYLNLSPQGSNPGPGSYKVFMYVACNLRDPSVRLLDMKNPSEPYFPATASCPLAVQFEVGSKKYLLRMNANDGTDDVIVTRLSETAWQILPSATSGSNRARLFLQGKGNTGLVAQGVYYMSFSIDVTTQ